MIVLGSAFRNSVDSIPAYMKRAAFLTRAVAPEQLLVLAVEGDSTDETRTVLQHEAFCKGVGLELITCNHGGPVFGSVESEERFKALSKVGNAIFSAVPEEADVLVYIESDLQWEAETILELISLARRQPAGFDIFAPMVMAGELFYDTWGFRYFDGQRFSPWAHLQKDMSPLLEVSSVGSCLAMRGEVARKVRIHNDYCLVGWCEEAREQNFRIAVVPSLRVRQL